MPYFPPYAAILTDLALLYTSYRNNRNCSTVFNKDPTKNVYLVIIYKKTWYLSESKTIGVHCRGAKMYFPIFSFWEACAKNVKYYKL